MKSLSSCAWLFCIAFMSVPSEAVSEATPQIHHEMEVRLAPEDGTLTVQDRIRFLQPLTAGVGELGFTLNAGLEPSLEAPQARLLVKDTGDAQVPFKRYVIAHDGPLTAVTLRYSGRLTQRPGAPGQTGGGQGDFVRGHIGPRGVFLTGASHWYPRFTDELVSFSLEVRMPTGWTAVSQGERGWFASESGDSVVQWRERRPQDDIVVAANRFEIYSRITPAADALVMLHRPDAVIAERYLEATARYLDLYGRLIGPYPYAKFALVENFWETGYAMPSLTLLGPRVLRLPFIIDSSYPHEILHSWWGNSVYVDYEHGNWSEGLTAYLADHLMRESRGGGDEFRRSALEKYRNYVSREKDFPLSRFRAKHGEVSEAVGYNKTLMFFHMLRRRLGDRTFIEALRNFYAEQRFRVAGYAELQASFEGVSGLDLAFEFDQWVNRVGAPQLRVRDLRVAPAGSGYRLRGRLEQVQLGPVYRLVVPVAVELEGQAKAHWREINMADRALEFDLALPGRPMRFAVDPEFDLFRRLDLAESPPALSELFGADDVLFVLPGAAPEGLHDAYRDLAERLGARRGARDDNPAQLPADRPVWLLGWGNQHRAIIAKALAEQSVDFYGDGVSIEGSRRSRGHECVVLTGRRSNAARSAIGWVGCDNRRAFAGLARKLPHYGKYGFLSFRGDAPSNVLKGQWRVTESPLIVRLDQAAGWAPLQPVRRARLLDAIEGP